MPYRIDLTPRAAKDLERLPKAAQRKVARWLDLLAEDPRCPASKKLEATVDLYRVHAGKDYVIIYTICDETVLILVVRIAHRSEAYRRL